MAIPAGSGITGRMYATVAELTEWNGGSTPANAELLLIRATRDVDRALLCAVYDVDDDGNATDADVIAALKAATLEQVSGNLGVGNSTGLGRSSAGFTLGKLSVQRGSSTAGDPAAPQKIGPLWEQAWIALQQEPKITMQGPQST